MLYLFTGTPGSGKSLHAAKIIKECLATGRRRDGRFALPVIANFDINPDTRGYDGFTYVNNFELTPDWLYEYAEEYWQGIHVKEETIYLFIDEAQLIFNSRDWSQHDRMAWIEFLSQHRHYGYRIYFMCQFDRMIDRQIRSLAEYEVKHRKVSSIGWKGKVVKLLCFGELFVAVTVYYGMNEKVGAEFYRARKSLFRLYDSYSRFRRVGGAEGGELGPLPDAPTARADSANDSCGATEKLPTVKQRPFCVHVPERVTKAFNSLPSPQALAAPLAHDSKLWKVAPAWSIDRPSRIRLENLPEV